MNAREFFYWLQDYFELTDAAAVVINPTMARCILSHIDLVPANERGEGVIEVRTLTRLASTATSEAAARSLTHEIVKVVAGVFEHVIDPQAGDAKVQDELNAKHNQHRPPGERPTYRY